MLVKLSLAAMISLTLFIAARSAANATEPEFACAPRADFVAGLDRNFGETLQAGGLSGIGGITNFQSVIEFYANIETGTWTLMGTDAEGDSCLLSSGLLYSEPAEPLAGDLN